MEEIKPHFHCLHCGVLLKKIHVIPAFQFQEQTIYTCDEHFWVRFKPSGNMKELKIDWSEKPVDSNLKK